MKAQYIGQIFVYILAIVLVSFILLFGYKAISNFKGKMEDINYADMRNELINSVKSITGDYGSVIKVEVDIPREYNEVCFVRSYGGYPESIGSYKNEYPLIEQSVKDEIIQNVFFISDVEEKPFDVGKITLDRESRDFLCIDVVSGKIQLRLEGKGDHADISEWPRDLT